MYNIDYLRLLNWLIPEALRLPKRMALLRAFLSPVKVLYNDFKNRRDIDAYRLAHNSQVCYLEAALNDSFDSSLRRIYITDGNRFNQLYIYTEVEAKPIWLKMESENEPVYLQKEDAYAGTNVDFIVVVPPGLVYNKFEMGALINYYKLPNKRYSIEAAV